MIVVEPVPVHRTAVLTRGNFRADDDSVIEPFRRLTDACHEAADGDVVMIQQLYHVGQHGDADNSFAPNWSPSGLPSMHDADGSHAVTEAEIDELIGAFTRAAVRARRAGFDGVELFAAYHALIDQFWTPWSNRRTDRWGGSLENRVRFSATLLDGVRTGVRRRLRRRPRRQPRPDVGRVAVGRRAAGDRRLARRAGADGLRHVRHGQLLRLQPPHADVAVPAATRRAVRRGAEGGRRPRRRAGGEPHPHAGRRRGGARRRPRRHGVDRARPDRRPAPRRQGPPRAAGRGAAVHLVQPAVLGPAIARLLDLVPRQPVGRARVRVGRRPLRRRAVARSVCSSSAVDRPGWRPRESPPSAATRSRCTSRRASSAGSGGWPAASRAAGRSSITSPWYAYELARLGVDRRARLERRRRRRSQRPAPTTSSWRPAPHLRAGRSSAACGSPTGCRAIDDDRFAAAEDVLAGMVVPSGTGAARRRPRGLARHRHGDAPAGVRLRRHDRHVGAGRRRRAVPQRRRTSRRGGGSRWPADGWNRTRP